MCAYDHHNTVYQKGSWPNRQHQSNAGQTKLLTSHYNSSTSQSTPNNNKQVNEGIKFTTSSTADKLNQGKIKQEALAKKVGLMAMFLDIYCGAFGSTLEYHVYTTVLPQYFFVSAWDL